MSNKLKYLDKKGLAKVFSLIKFGHKKIWHGTLAEWEALSAEEKAEYDQAEVIDEYTGVPVVVDKVEAGNLNPVTSNAVAGYIRNQNILSDYETVTLPFTAQYDGELVVNCATNSGVNLKINGVDIAWGVYAQASSTSNSVTVTVKKGDVISTVNVYKDAHARFYKLRDYTGR